MVWHRPIRTKRLRPNDMTSLRRSLALTFLSTNGSTAVQFLVTIIIARLLDPDEIGIYSITAVMVSIAHIFRDFGVASYLQQEKELTTAKVGAAFGVLLSSSWFIAGLVFLLSWPAAKFYAQDGIKEVMQVLALGFIFIPFGAVTHSLLTRDYRAKEQAYVRIISTLAYALSAVGLAYMGYSYMSMAWANLINIVVTAIAYIPFRPKIVPWLPQFSGWRKVLNFGTGATLGNSLGAINSAIPDIVLGKVSGPYDVGLMSRGWSTTNLLNQVIGPTISYAILPYLSKAHHSGESMDTHLLRGSSYITGIMWPAFVATAIFSQSIILFLYGEKWLAATDIMQWLAVMFILTTPFGFLPSTYLAIGRPYLSTLPTIANLTSRGIAILLLYNGTLISFSWALVLAAAMMYPFHMWMQKHYLHLTVRSFLSSQIASVAVTLICTAFAGLIWWLMQGFPAALIVSAAGLILPIIWITSIWVTKHPLRQEIELFLKNRKAITVRES